MSLSLVLEEIDPGTACVQAQASLNIQGVDEIEGLIDIDFEGDLEVEFEYELSPEAMAAIKDRYGIENITGEVCGRLRRRNALDDLPYQIHTGRELLLMKSGIKPMSFFAYFEGDDSGLKEEVDFSFGPYVASGAIERREHQVIVHQLDPQHQRNVRYVIYTLPGEAWRAHALILLKQSGLKSGWSEGMERMEGALLGYEDWQNDVHLEMVFRTHDKHQGPGEDPH